jgi:hypothetical protein
VRRHCVQHLIAQHHAAHHGRHSIGPLHAVTKAGQGLTLLLTQGTRHLHDDVAAHALTQGVQHLLGQGARAGAELEHLVGLRGLQGLRHLGRQGAAEEG